MFLDWLFPPICQGCGQIGQWVCKACLSQAEFYPNPIEIKLENSALHQVFAATYFQPPIKQIIQALKYHNVKDLGRWLGEWLYEVTLIPQVDYVTAIPLHPGKKAQRGYNQAELIARALAHQLHLPYLPLLIKTRATAPQMTITEKAERLQQLTDVFALNPLFQQPQYLSQLQQSRILLIDDVITTGATLNAAAHALRQIGIQQVMGLAVAHGQ